MEITNMSIPIHDGRTNDLYQTLAKCEDLNDMQLFLDSTEQMGGGITEQITQEGGISEEPQTEANADNSVSGEEFLSITHTIFTF